MGYDVALHYNRSADEAEQLAQCLRADYPERQFPLVPFDLEEWQQAGAIFDLLPNGFGPLSVLVNNASVFVPGTLAQIGPETLLRDFAVHFFSPLRLMQEFRARYQQGLVVNMLDTKITTNEFSHASYLLSKKTMAELTRMTALEWAPQVRVNGIAPGPVLPAVGAAHDRFDKVVAQSPMAEAVTEAEIGETVGYFLRCPHVTGQIVYVDSGTHLQ